MLFLHARIGSPDILDPFMLDPDAYSKISSSYYPYVVCPSLFRSRSGAIDVTGVRCQGRLPHVRREVASSVTRHRE